MQQFTSILLALAPYLLPPLLAFIGLEAKKAWDKLPTNQRALLSNVVGTAVTAVQQTMPDAGNVTKKSRAIELVLAQLAHLGLNVPAPVLDQLIEEAVFSMKGFLQVVTPAPVVVKDASPTDDTLPMPKTELDIKRP